MKAVLLGLLTLVSHAWAQTDGSVAILTQFDRPASDAVIASLQEELGVILQPAGYRFEWRAVHDATGHDSYRELVVVSFRGECEAPAETGSREPGGPLAWTHTSGDEVLPFAEVHCGRVQNLLRAELRWDSKSERERKMGRALARVLAHELYHVFVQTRKHVSCGVAKSSHSASELTSKEFRFDEDTLEALRAHHAEIHGEVVDTENSQ
jgi:hypothetical protein